MSLEFALNAKVRIGILLRERSDNMSLIEDYGLKSKARAFFCFAFRWA